MTYACPVCRADSSGYMRCYHPACPDGRDPGHPNNRPRADDRPVAVVLDRKLSPHFPTEDQLAGQRRAATITVSAYTGAIVAGAFMWLGSTNADTSAAGFIVLLVAGILGGCQIIASALRRPA